MVRFIKRSLSTNWCYIVGIGKYLKRQRLLFLRLFPHSDRLKALYIASQIPSKGRAVKPASRFLLIVLPGADWCWVANIGRLDCQKEMQPSDHKTSILACCCSYSITYMIDTRSLMEMEVKIKTFGYAML